MIPKLRKKFISITAVALFTMILLVVGSINFVFILQNIRLLSSHLDLLLDVYGNDSYHAAPGSSPALFDELNDFRHIPPEGDFDDPTQPKDSGFGLDRRGAPRHDFSLFPRFENDLRVRADGCVVLLDDEGRIADIRQDAAENYSAGELESIVADIFSRGETEGWHQYYRYRVTALKARDGIAQTAVGLVNASSTLYAIFTMLSVSAIIGVLSFLLVLFIIIFASSRAVRPIAESYTKQKQFVTDAGHELKTPLTVISANNELARMIYGDSEWFDSIDKQVGKMNGLVRSLVTLAKMDEEEKPVLTSFNLSDAVYDTAKSFENLIQAKGRILTLDIEDGIMYTGDESRLRQVVSILVDNAVKYCSEQGKIAIRLTAQKSIQLTVTNDYAASGGFDLDKVFERFYRADKARTPDGSYGLGLSIAKTITEMHKGEIRAEVLEHNRVRFEVTLPKGRLGSSTQAPVT